MKEILKLREYQKEAAKFAMDHNMAVLGMAPGSGKTEISIFVIQELLRLHPEWRVLVLTHSTLILKNNFFSRLEKFQLDPQFTYSQTFADAKVHVTLPQNIGEIWGKYDLLIVDEAHENYFANNKITKKEGLVERIIKRVKPVHQILLTGTPSKFIGLKKYDMYFLPLNELPNVNFAKLNFELIVSKYNWRKEDLNADQSLKTNKSHFKFEQTRGTLDELVKKLMKRVEERLTDEEFNNPTTLTKLKTWAFNFNKLKKTLIVCRTIPQGEDVQKILNEHGVNCEYSNSKNDPENKKLLEFKNNKHNVLIVIDRARLGYDDEDLFNIIDMSGTHNPNVINQMFSRVIRGNQKMEKWYIKVTTQEYGMMDYTKACMNAALMLTDRTWLSTFNGRNFNGMLIPVVKNPIKTKSKHKSGNTNSKRIKTTSQKFIFPEFTHDVVELLRDVLHDLKQPVSIYKAATIREVKDAIFEIKRYTMEQVHNLIKFGVEEN